MLTLKQAISAPLRLRQLVKQFASQQPQKRTLTTFKLNTGATIPAIGFGTWQDKDAQEGAVLAALKAGYKHIDGAAVYVLSLFHVAVVTALYMSMKLQANDRFHGC